MYTVVTLLYTRMIAWWRTQAHLEDKIPTVQYMPYSSEFIKNDALRLHTVF